MKRVSARHLFSNQSGSILMLVGLSFLFLVGIAGSGYDLGRQQLVRQKIQQASDAAALAGAGLIMGTPPGVRIATAQRYFQLNYPNTYLGVPRPTPTITINANDIQVSASALLTTNFVTNLGINTMNSAGFSSAQFKRGYNKVDVILVLDNSGSMGYNYDVGSINSLNGNPGTAALCTTGWTSLLMTYYGYTPAAATAAAPGYCFGPPVTSASVGTNGFNRMNSLRYSATDMTNLFMNPNPNDNQMALVTWDITVMNTLNFTNDPVPVKTFLNNMYGRGQTNSTAGLSQAQAMGAAGFRPAAIHAVILMTDGGNYTGGSYPDPAVNASTLGICSSLKASGTLVYTIGFGGELANASASSATARQFLSDCATGPNGPAKPNQNVYYFSAPNAAALQAAFTAIAGSLQALRILN